MSFEISRNGSTGSWSLQIKRNLLVTLGIGLVLGGFGAMANPWWLGILVALFDKAGVPVGDGYSWLIGGIQLLIGFSLLIYVYFIENPRNSKIAADKATLAAGGLQINSLRQYFSDLVDDHSFLSSRDTDFQHSFTYFLNPESKFQLKKTAEIYSHYSQEAADLHAFVGQYFFYFSNGIPEDYRYCLMPHYNEDREMINYDSDKVQKYNDLANILSIKVNKTRNAFDKLVTHFKILNHI